jgi:hypothetical protein
VTLGDDSEKGLVLLQGLAMGLRGNGEDGVEGVENVFVESPKWILALKTTFCKRVSGPKAKRNKSFSEGTCMRIKPIILAAFSGSKLLSLVSSMLVIS